MRKAGLPAVVVAIVAIVAIGLAGLSGTAGTGPGEPSPVASPEDGGRPSLPPATRAPVASRSAESRAPLDPAEAAFADAYLILAEAHDDVVVELLIANPLAEFDLVGVPLTDLVDETRNRLAGLPRLPSVAGEVERLEREMGAVVDLLRAIDPHGPRLAMAETYREALDHWVDNVRPATEAIRTMLGLPPPEAGDLRL